MYQEDIAIETKGRGLIDITAQIDQIVRNSSQKQGICHVFIQHTSASLIICEAADPSVQSDLENFMQRLVPDGDSLFQHTYEGVDDMPAHVKSSTIGVQLTLPITNRSLNLGTWQGIYLCEHRDHPTVRRAIATIFGQRAK